MTRSSAMLAPNAYRQPFVLFHKSIGLCQLLDSTRNPHKRIRNLVTLQVSNPLKTTLTRMKHRDIDDNALCLHSFTHTIPREQEPQEAELAPTRIAPRLAPHPCKMHLPLRRLLPADQLRRKSLQTEMPDLSLDASAR